MKISDIKQQIKVEGRYSIYVDGKFAFGLSEQALMNSGLNIGKEITKAELAELKDTARADKAYFLALGQISRRQRSEWEMRDYFGRKGYEPELIQELIDKLYKSSWLDDEKFAQAWVSNRRLLKSTSRRRLQQELRAKRVSDEIITKVIAEDETDEQQVLQKLVEVKRRQSRYQDDQKLMAYLMRQGYNYQDIKQAVQGP